MAYPVSLKRSPSKNQQRVSPIAPSRSAQVSKQKHRSKYLDDRHWKPYQNSMELAEQIYQLTHLEEPTFAELEREADLVDILEPLQRLPSLA